MSIMNTSINAKRMISTLLPVLLVVVGLLSLLLPQAYVKFQSIAGGHANSQYWEKSNARHVSGNYALGIPTKFSMTRLGIEINIKPGHYSSSSQTWSLDRTHAFYIAPGESPLNPNSIPLIYGHDIPAVFKKLDRISNREPLVITNLEGKRMAFVYEDDEILKPHQGQYLNKELNDGKHLHVLTCTGPFFSERRIMNFVFVGMLDTSKDEL